MNSSHFSRFWIAVALALALPGCARDLPPDLRVRATSLQNARSAAQVEIADAKAALRESKASSDAAFLGPYARREGWEANLTQAQAALDQAQSLLSQKVQPALTRNARGEAEALGASLAQIEALLQSARGQARGPQDRLQQLQGFRTQAPQLVERAGQAHRRTQSVVGEIRSQLRAASVAYQGKKTELRAQNTAFVDMETQSANELRLAKAELDKFQRTQPAEFRLLERRCQQVAQIGDAALAGSKEWRQKLDELGQSRTETLVDMKVDYYVQIGRESWNESSESEATNEYLYPPRLVDKPTYDYFARFAEDQVLASKGSGWFSRGFGLQNGVDAANWARLGIDPDENLSDGTAEWSLDGVDEKYFHKYLLVRNGVVEETPWLPVTLAFFETHDDDLGMDILTKPAGTYESEVSRFASPAGMSYVGDSRYGRWRADSNGNRVWEFAATYLIFNNLLGSSRRYSAAEWNDWRVRGRNRAAYYGQKQREEEDRYGSHSRSVGGNAYFARSHWVGSGEHRAQVASVRGAGSAARGGGPGGGGK